MVRFKQQHADARIESVGRTSGIAQQFKAAFGEFIGDHPNLDTGAVCHSEIPRFNVDRFQLSVMLDSPLRVLTPNA